MGDHLRELRHRIIVSGLAILLGSALGWLVYQPLLDFLTEPLKDMALLRGGLVNLNFGGIANPFSVQVKVAIFVGIIIACPVWLYQCWAYIVPGLTAREKRTSIVFIIVAVPLFLAGCYSANWALPNAVKVLLGFTPEEAVNLIPASDYLTFVTRFILVFGLAALLPVFLVALNVAHLLPAQVMLRGWRIALLLIFVFAAMVTPTPDAWTMLALAVPMVGLYFLAVGVATLLDLRRRRREPHWTSTPDDEASSLL